ncbi:MAG: hypothetical protein CMJ80_12940, partial [Planctomycetaceae bacterium]|nr:hypothetical protein [Planctomycetaceae bacterium]
EVSEMPRIHSLQDRNVDHQRMRELIQHVAPNVVHFHRTDDLTLMEQTMRDRPTVLTNHGYQMICPAEDFYMEFGRRVCEKSHVSESCYLHTCFGKCMSWRLNAARKQYARASWGVKNINSFSAIIYPSHRSHRRFEGLISDPGKHFVLPYFCPIKPLDTVPIKTHEIKTITFLGRIREYKGYRDFIKLLSLLENVRGLMVGDFTEESSKKVEAIGNREGVAHRLERREWCTRAELSSLMEETDVFIFPSLWPETLGIVGLEALANGVPVVAYDIGGVSEWLISGKTGYAVPVKNVKSLADSVRELLNDASARYSFGEQGLELVRAKFSLESHINDLLHIYRTCI